MIHKVKGPFLALVTDPWRRGGQRGLLTISHECLPLVPC